MTRPPYSIIGRMEVKETPLQKPRSVMLSKFWDGVLSGNFTPYTQAELQELVDKTFFVGETLSPLTFKENELLRQHLAADLEFTLNGQRLKEFCGPVMFVPKECIPPVNRETYYFETSDSFIVGDLAVEAINNGMRPMGVEEKLQKYQDPSIWEETRIIDRSRSDETSVGQGSRPFFKQPGIDSYGFTRERFSSVVASVSSRTGKANLKLADFGGNTGRACYQIKSEYPHFALTNITIDEEPAMWPDVEHVFVPAERLPAKFRETFDLAISNIAWRYFVFPDIALKNLLHSLSIGGQAEIAFGGDRCPLPPEDVIKRTHSAIKLLDTLEKEGIIETQRWFSQFYRIPQGYLSITKNKRLPL